LHHIFPIVVLRALHPTGAPEEPPLLLGLHGRVGGICRRPRVFLEPYLLFLAELLFSLKSLFFSFLQGFVGGVDGIFTGFRVQHSLDVVVRILAQIKAALIDVVDAGYFTPDLHSSPFLHEDARRPSPHQVVFSVRKRVRRPFYTNLGFRRAPRRGTI